MGLYVLSGKVFSSSVSKDMRLIIQPLRVLTLLVGLTCLFTANATAWLMEAGNGTTTATIGNNGQFTRVNFQQTYSSPPLVFVTGDDADGQPAEMRVVGIDTTGFFLAPTEPQGNNGPHAAMPFSYIAVEPGIHDMGGGYLLTAGTISTTSTMQGNGGSMTSVGLSNPTIGNAIVLAEIQTMNNETNLIPYPDPAGNGFPNPSPFLTVAIDNVGSNSFDLALDMAETTTGSVSVNETIAYLAVSNSSTATSNQFTANGNTITFDAFNGSNIDGWTQGCDNLPFPSSGYTANPVGVIDLQIRDADGGWIRQCARSSTGITATIDEDRAADNERVQSASAVAIFSFSQPFWKDFGDQADLVVSKDNALNYYTPGQNATFVIRAYNLGPADVSALTLTDNFPDGATPTSASCSYEDKEANSSLALTLTLDPTAGGTLVVANAVPAHGTGQNNTWNGVGTPDYVTTFPDFYIECQVTVAFETDSADY